MQVVWCINNISLIYTSDKKLGIGCWYVTVDDIDEVNIWDNVPLERGIILASKIVSSFIIITGLVKRKTESRQDLCLLQLDTILSIWFERIPLHLSIKLIPLFWYNSLQFSNLTSWKWNIIDLIKINHKKLLQIKLDNKAK
jgi:hypothetical protein